MSSEWTVHLVFEEGTSSKFWRARVDGKTLTVNYGKIGAVGQKQVKDFSDNAGALAEYDKLIREKRKKGYADVAGEGGAAAAPAVKPASRGDDDGDDEGGDDEDDDEGGDDEDDDEAPRKKPAKPAGKPAAAAAPAAAPSVPGHRLTLDAGSRKVTATLYLDGKTVRMDSIETYASPEAASKAFDRLKKMLAGEGYKP